jgi:hypothetical protein
LPRARGPVLVGAGFAAEMRLGFQIARELVVPRLGRGEIAEQLAGVGIVERSAALR